MSRNAVGSVDNLEPLVKLVEFFSEISESDRTPKTPSCGRGAQSSSTARCPGGDGHVGEAAGDGTRTAAAGDVRPWRRRSSASTLATDVSLL